MKVQITPEDAQRVLKDLVFSTWAADGCEARADTLKMVSLVDFFLPFLPLERRHIEALFHMRLEETAAQLRRSQSVQLTWTPDIITFLTDKACLRSASNARTILIGTCQWQASAPQSLCLISQFAGGVRRLAPHRGCEGGVNGHDAARQPGTAHMVRPAAPELRRRPSRGDSSVEAEDSRPGGQAASAHGHSRLSFAGGTGCARSSRTAD